MNENGALASAEVVAVVDVVLTWRVAPVKIPLVPLVDRVEWAFAVLVGVLDRVTVCMKVEVVGLCETFKEIGTGMTVIWML
jgi:hypothetical protein